MSDRGFVASDYAWSSVVQAAAHLLMDEGAAANRPLSVEDIAAVISTGRNIPQGDTRRAAFKIEGHEDRGRGAVLLAQEAVKGMLRSKVIEERADGYVWISKRASFVCHGSKIVLRSKEEREALDEQARAEVAFIGLEFNGLPKREFDPESEDGKALLASLASGYDDNLPPIIMDGERILNGRMRQAACELLGIDWRRHTKQVNLPPLTDPQRNLEHYALAVRANISIPLSPSTRREISKTLRAEGHSPAEIAEALNVSSRTVKRDVRRARGHVSPGTADSAKVDDETLLGLIAETVREDPKVGRRKAGVLVRERHGVEFGNNRIDKLMPQAQSLVELGIVPEAKPEEPQGVEEPDPTEIGPHTCPLCGALHSA